MKNSIPLYRKLISFIFVLLVLYINNCNNNSSFNDDSIDTSEHATTIFSIYPNSSNITTLSTLSSHITTTDMTAVSTTTTITTPIENGIPIGWICKDFNGWQTTGSCGSSGCCSSHILNYPIGLVQDNNGDIFIADANGERVVKYDSEANLIGWFGGGYTGWQTGIALSMPSFALNSFHTPIDVAVDDYGFIYVTENYNNRVSKWDSNANPIGWFGGGYTGWQTNAYSINYGYGLGSFYSPQGIVLDNSGNIYIANFSGQNISKYDTYGSPIGWIGGSNDNWHISGSASSSDYYKSFHNPSNLSIGKNGEIYISDFWNNRISKWDSNGVAQGWIGGGFIGWQTSGSASMGDGLGYFSCPSAPYLASEYLYISDRNNNRICKWDASSGKPIGWIGGGYNGWQTSGQAIAGRGLNYFNTPYEVFVNNQGEIFVADSLNYRVCKWKD